MLEDARVHERFLRPPLTCCNNQLGTWESEYVRRMFISTTSWSAGGLVLQLK